jgi:hypothetical protein
MTVPSLRRVSALAVAVTGLLVATAPVSASALVVPSMGVAVYGEGTASWTVCAGGTADSLPGLRSGMWVFTVEGFRSDGTTIFDRVIVDHLQSDLDTFSECIGIPKKGPDSSVAAPDGLFTATLSYAGVGLDVAGTFVGYGRWGFGLPDDSAGSGFV